MNEDITEFEYKNYRNEISWRRIKYIAIYRGSTDWHPHKQLLIKAFDEEKKAIREFALFDIIKFKEKTFIPLKLYILFKIIHFLGLRF